MQIKKLLAAGALATLMAGSTIAFAADMNTYPSPFVTSAGVDTLVVVGATAAPSDVVGAIDLATRLGGEVTTEKTIKGTTAALSVSGEGKGVATTNTKVYLNDSLGKSGLRTTMTKDDLPTLLKSGSVSDSDGTHNYQQLIYITPSSTSSTSYVLQYEKPATGVTADPEYRFGDFPTSVSAVDYMYKTSVIFDKEINLTASTNLVGEKLNVFGKEYTILSDSTFVASSVTSNKLILSGGAETKTLSSGEKTTVTLAGVAYDVTLLGASSSTQAVVQVGSDSKTLTKAGSTTKVGGLDIYVSDVYYLSSTDQTQNKAKLLLGAEKLTLQHANAVKKGSSDDTVQGTLVNLTVSSGKLSAFTIYVGGASTETDFLGIGKSYTDPVWKSFDLSFNSLSPGATDSSRNVLDITPSGNNYGKATIKDDKGQTATITFAYKSSDSATGFSLQDSSGYAIHVAENETITQNEYFIVDQGDFSHMYQVTGVNLVAGDTSSYIDIRDVFSGVTTRVSTSSDLNDEKVIDGQTYYFRNRTTSNTFSVTWGSGSPGLDALGTYLTVFPVMKGNNGEKYAFAKANQTVNITGVSKIQLPTGAVTITADTQGGAGGTLLNFTATTMEDGTSSVCATTEGTSATNCITNFNASGSATQAFMLGKTATGGVWYNISTGNTAYAISISVGYGAGGTTRQSAVRADQPVVLLIEEKDSNNDIHSALFTVSTEASGSSNVVKAEVPAFTFKSVNGDSLTTDSNKLRYVDLYGLYAERQTSGQDTIKVYYPDEQATANVFVLSTGSSVSSSGGTTETTYKEATPVKTALGKLDSEITSTDKNEKNLILVGGPCVNTLVRELMNAQLSSCVTDFEQSGKYPAGTAMIKLYESAFGTSNVALVVAGHEAADSRAATGVLQAYDNYKTTLVGKEVKVATATSTVTSA